VETFKFFSGWVRNIRNYMGLTRGEIKWIELPVFFVYYTERNIITGGHINEVGINLMSRSYVLGEIVTPSFSTFLESHQNDYIVISNIRDVNGVIYDQNNQSDIPNDVELIILGKIIRE